VGAGFCMAWSSFNIFGGDRNLDSESLRAAVTTTRGVPRETAQLPAFAAC
jgi:hypothetical protein